MCHGSVRTNDVLSINEPLLCVMGLLGPMMFYQRMNLCYVSYVLLGPMVGRNEQTFVISCVSSDT